MTLKKKKTRRCDKKATTPEGNLLKYLRESRKLSMRRAAELIGTSSATVNHTENGRRDINTSTIIKFCEAYGYSLEEFNSLKSGNLILPEHTRSECIKMINRLDDQKLKTVKAFLNTFLGN